MSTTRERRAVSINDIPATAHQEPQPWLSAEDTTGWKRIPRRKRGPGYWPMIGVEVDFDHEQSAWLRAEGKRIGLDYVSLVKKLVDDARGAA